MDDARSTFRIERCLGRGGFGEVYRAEMASPTGIVTPVALKVLRRDILAPGSALARLRDEGRMLARLEHPAILHVYDLVVIEGRVALVTELVDGVDLEDVLFGGERLPLRAAADVLSTVASALSAAYESPVGDGGVPLRLVHRDVKPSNIRIGQHGEVKLLDFGIARSDEMAREARTRTDTLLGSPPYMAPERFIGATAHPAADVYAIGAMAIEVMLGERLFQLPMPALAALSMDPDRYRVFLDSRLASLPGDAVAYVALARQLLSFDPVARPNAAEVFHRLEILSDELPGLSLSRFCRERRSAATLKPGERGELEGKIITATAHGFTVRREEKSVAPAHTLLTHALPTNERSISSASVRLLKRTGSSFFGRGEELAALTEAWLADVRLLTVRGPAGMGKTRLVSEHLQSLLAHQPSLGSAFVSLVGISSLPDLLTATAAALDLALVGRSDDDNVAVLGRALHNRAPFVLVLDNAEQFVEIVASVVQRWCAPGLHLIVTSRRALQIDQEQIVELSSMRPDDALELLLDRARRVRWDYEPPAAERDALRDLAQTDLDGLPLALELAGARLDVLDVSELADALRSRMGLLSGGRGASHWSSMRAALEGSWNLLHDDEKHALCCLGVFASSFDRLAAEAVLGKPSTDQLRALIDHSLLQRDGSRFRLLEAVGEFAREQLEATGEAERVRERHRRWFASVVAPKLQRAEQGAGLYTDAQLGDIDNLKVAHASAICARDIDSAVPLARGLDSMINIRGPFRLRIPLLESTLSLLTGDHPARLELISRLGDALRVAGQLEQARTLLQGALEQGRRLGQTAEIWTALFALYSQTREHVQLKADLDEALAAVRSVGDKRREGIILRLVALVEHSLGAYVRAYEAARAATAIFRSLGNVHLETASLVTMAFSVWHNNDEALDLLARAQALACSYRLVAQESVATTYLANMRVTRGEWSAALEAYDRAWKLVRSLGDIKGEWRVAQGRAVVLFELGDLDKAAEQLEQLAREQMGSSSWSPLHTRLMQAVVERARRHPHEAELLIRATLREAQTRGDGSPSTEAYFKIHLASVLAATSRPDEAERLLDSLETFYRGRGDTVSEQLLQLGRIQILHARGASAEIIEEALAAIDRSDQEVKRMIRLFRAGL